MKIIMLLLLIVATVPLSQAAKWECVRWSWTGDVYNRKVVCLEWRKKDKEQEQGKKK
jgi:hypothetical protein